MTLTEKCPAVLSADHFRQAHSLSGGCNDKRGNGCCASIHTEQLPWTSSILSQLLFINAHLIPFQIG